MSDDKDESKKDTGPSRTSLAFLGFTATVLIAMLVKDLYPDVGGDRLRMEKVLRSLLEQETHIDTTRRPRVAVGYGACRDLFVRSRDILGEEDAPEEPEHFLQIENEQQFKSMLAYFFQHGAAAEYEKNTEETFHSISLTFIEMSLI